MITTLVSFATGNWQRLAIYALLALILLGSAAGWGYMRGVERLYSYQAEQAKATVRVVVKQGAITVRVVTKYVQGKARSEQTQQTTHEEVARYEKDNPGLCLDARWRVLHDSAAAGILPASPGGTEAKANAPPAATALATVSANYAAHNDCADELEALQDWAAQQAAVKP